MDIGIGRNMEVHGVRRMCVSSDDNCESPRSAITYVYILQFGTYSKRPATKVLLMPQTGLCSGVLHAYICQ